MVDTRELYTWLIECGILTKSDQDATHVTIDIGINDVLVQVERRLPEDVILKPFDLSGYVKEK